MVLAVENPHDQVVVPGAVEVAAVAFAALEQESACPVDGDRGRVEGEDPQVHAVKPEGAERVVQHQPGGFRTVAVPEVLRCHDPDREPRLAVGRRE